MLKQVVAQDESPNVTPSQVINFALRPSKAGYEAFSVNLGMLFGGQNPNPILNFFGMHTQLRTHP